MPKGQVSLAIEGAAVTTEIQQAMLDPRVEPLASRSSVRASTEYGVVTATALRFGRGLTTLHVWLRAGPAEVKRMIVEPEGAPPIARSEFPLR